MQRKVMISTDARSLLPNDHPVLNGLVDFLSSTFE
jgi:hypothetical protein